MTAACHWTYWPDGRLSHCLVFHCEKEFAAGWLHSKITVDKMFFLIHLRDSSMDPSLSRKNTTEHKSKLELDWLSVAARISLILRHCCCSTSLHVFYQRCLDILFRTSIIYGSVCRLIYAQCSDFIVTVTFTGKLLSLSLILYLGITWVTLQNWLSELAVPDMPVTIKTIVLMYYVYLRWGHILWRSIGLTVV